MNLGQLVRSKMKELNSDKSGEYIDNRGNHFKMSAEGDGYSISYGGGKSVGVTREQGCKLASNCRKLESERKELASDKARFLRRELEQYDLTDDEQSIIYKKLVNKVELMSAHEISAAIEDCIEDLP